MPLAAQREAAEVDRDAVARDDESIAGTRLIGRERVATGSM